MRDGWSRLRTDWARDGRIYVPAAAGAWYSTWSYLVFGINDAVLPAIADAVSSHHFHGESEEYTHVLVATSINDVAPEDETLFNQAKRYFYVVDGFMTVDYGLAFAEAVAQNVKGSRTWTGNWHEVDGKHIGDNVLELANHALGEIQGR